MGNSVEPRRVILGRPRASSRPSAPRYSPPLATRKNFGRHRAPRSLVRGTCKNDSSSDFQFTITSSIPQPSLRGMYHFRLQGWRGGLTSFPCTTVSLPLKGLQILYNNSADSCMFGPLPPSMAMKTSSLPLLSDEGFWTIQRIGQPNCLHRSAALNLSPIRGRQKQFTMCPPALTACSKLLRPFRSYKTGICPAARKPAGARPQVITAASHPGLDSGSWKEPPYPCALCTSCCNF
mmetsp:Transcript_68827/g.178758  ORF Transcript_68827/g.178758 Transcript_68827/m.178758 type:complete len:235 (-) Transcript_68827:939-1643(-)